MTDVKIQDEIAGHEITGRETIYVYSSRRQNKPFNIASNRFTSGLHCKTCSHNTVNYYEYLYSPGQSDSNKM